MVVPGRMSAPLSFHWAPELPRACMLLPELWSTAMHVGRLLLYIRCMQRAAIPASSYIVKLHCVCVCVRFVSASSGCHLDCRQCRARTSAADAGMHACNDSQILWRFGERKCNNARTWLRCVVAVAGPGKGPWWTPAVRQTSMRRR